MFAQATIAALLFASVASAADFTISTPASLVECQPAAISWSGGTANYILDVIPGEQVSAASLEEIGSSITGTTVTWTVNLASGTYVTLKLIDSTGAIAYSSAVTIQAGSDTSCLNSTATSAAAAAGATTGSVTATSVASGSSSAGAVSSVAGVSSASTSAVKSASSSVSRSASGSSTSAAGSSTASTASAAASSGAAYLSSSVGYSAVVLAAAGGLVALL